MDQLSKERGLVGRIHPDGGIDMVRVVEPHETRVLAVARERFETRTVKHGTPLLLIPASLAGTIKWVHAKHKVRKGPCEYEAVRAYCQNMFSVTLCLDDEDFFQNHPLTEAEGTPMAETLRVAQELVDPYGLRVSRVVCQPGLTLPGDLAQWQDVLGINPLAMFERVVSNAEFAEQAGMSLEEADRLFRFEFSDRIIAPAVQCAASASTVGFAHGHASYRSPRRSKAAEKPMLQFQLGRAELVPWNTVPVFAPLPEVELDNNDEEISLWATKFEEDGPTIGRLLTQEFTKVSTPPGTGNTVTEPAPKEALTLQDRKRLFSKLWAMLWSGAASSRNWRCHKCKTSFATMLPAVEQVYTTEQPLCVSGTCASCKTVNVLSTKEDGFVPQVVAAYVSMQEASKLPAPKEEPVKGGHYACTACGQNKTTFWNKDVCNDCGVRYTSEYVCVNPACDNPRQGFKYSGMQHRPNQAHDIANGWRVLGRCLTCNEQQEFSSLPGAAEFARACEGWKLLPREREALFPTKGELLQ